MVDPQIYRFQDCETSPDSFYDYSPSIRDNTAPLIIDNGEFFLMKYKFHFISSQFEKGGPEISVLLGTSPRIKGKFCLRISVIWTIKYIIEGIRVAF